MACSKEVINRRGDEQVLIALFFLGVANKREIEYRCNDHPMISISFPTLQAALLRLQQQEIVEATLPPRGGRVSEYRLTPSGLDLALRVDEYYRGENEL